MISERPLRLLQVTSTSEIGGAETLALNLIRNADPARLAPYLLALTGAGPLARLAEQAGTRGVNWALKDIGDPRLLRRMRQFLMRGGYDIVQTYGMRADLLARWPAQALRMRVVSSLVSLDPHRGPATRALDRLTRDGVTAWMSVSRAVALHKIEREAIPAHKVFVIPTGIPDRPVADDATRDRARRKFKIAPEDGPVLAVVANLRPAKGHPQLIDAARRLVEKWPRLVVICAGRDDSNGAIPESVRKAGLESNFRFPGFLSDAPQAYEAADLAVLPSLWEGMPHALIEALRAGVASVATDVGGVSEVIRHEREGLLCPPNDPAALAEAIARALSSDEARRAWSQSARQRYESDFRVEIMVERMTEFYEYLCARSPRPPSALA